MSKFKKIDKEFLLTDSTVNSYGFRLLSEGYQLAEFKKNPIGYHMHDRNAGVLVKWEDLRVDGDAVYGKPVINLSHARSQQTIDEIENGFLNAASVGHIVCLELSNDESMKLPNQKGPTVTRWFNRECSLVDIPGNFNALTLFDENENAINLADFTTQYKPEMKQVIFTASMLAAMKLSADTENTVIEQSFNDLVAKAAKADSLETELNDLKATTTKDKVVGILADGLKAGKLTKELSDKLAADYATNPDGLKDLVDAMPAYKSVTEQISDKQKKQVEDLSAVSWDELFRTDKLEDLKANNPELYKVKFKEEFGVEPKS
jgi:hypothetical protein